VVLTWVAATGAGWMGFLYLFVFSLGMTALLVAVGLFSGTVALLPRSGVWMVWVKRIAALIMLGMAEYYFVSAGYNM
jgi:thiol:disulfide interchange protein DsbD